MKRYHPFFAAGVVASAVFAAVETFGATVEVTWLANNDGNLEHYRVHWGQSSRGGTDEPSEFSYANVTTAAPSATPSATINGIDMSEITYFAVSAVGTNGLESFYSVEVPFPDPHAAAPSGLAVTIVSSSRLDLRWTDNSNNEDAFKVDRRQSGTSSWVRLVATVPNATVYSDTGLPSSTHFYYKVKAYNVYGNSAYTDLAAATTPALSAPAAPSHVVAQATASDRIRLSWTDNSDNEDGFRIDRRRSGTAEWIAVLPAAADAESCLDTGLPAGTRLYYKLTAFNSGGDSATTPPAAAVTPAASSWKYRKGVQEASAPVSAWRRAGYDDSGWAPASMPIGYGGSVVLGTVLADMPGNYSTIFLRKTFTVRDPALVSRITLDAAYDDGFVVWINGEEIARLNVAGQTGDAVRHNGLSATGDGAPLRCSLSFSGATIPALRAGTNVLAIQVFNCLLSGSSDLLLDPVFRVLEGSTLGVEADLDQDGISDAWETATFTDTSAANAASDRDGDGHSDIAEYVAGTSAQDSDDALCLQLGLSGGDLVVSFPTTIASGPGYDGLVRHYALQRCDDPGGWVTVPGYEDIAATGGPVSHVITSADATGCYRARVWLTD